MSPYRFEKVTIYGVGLMGGALGMALQQYGIAREVWGLGRNQARLLDAINAGVITHTSENRRTAVEDAEIIVVCLPIRLIPDMVLALAALASPGAVITDVGSTKHEIMAHLQRDMRKTEVHFVGSHPMCGSEKTGFEAATADLYVGATCAITPMPSTPETAITRLQGFWESVGARVIQLGPRQHDRLVARTSHLPHLLATALCHNTEMEMEAELHDLMVGPGFRDTTRVAQADENIWADIFLSNQDYLLDVLGDLQVCLESAHKILASGNRKLVTDWLAQGRSIRARYNPKPSGEKD